MTSRMLAALAVAIVGAVALLRSGIGPVEAGQVAEQPPTPTILVATDEENAAILKGVADAVAAKDPLLVAAAVLKMVDRKHTDFIPVIRKSLDDSDPSVVAAAIRAAASAELKDEEKRIRKLLRAKPKDVKDKNKQVRTPGEIPAACIDYLGRLGFGGEEEEILESHLIPFTGDERRVKKDWAAKMVSASLYYFGKFKYKGAVPFIVAECLAEPVPKNVNDPKNPPASYWQPRHDIWVNGGEGWARWALKEITGKEFRTIREWDEYVKANKKDFEK